MTERSGVLGDIVRRILDGETQCRLIGELPAERDVAAAVERTGAQAVIWLVDYPGRTGGAPELLRRHPELRILTVEADGRQGFLWEMRPNREPLGELSPQVLLTALCSSTEGGDA